MAVANTTKKPVQTNAAKSDINKNGGKVAAPVKEETKKETAPVAAKPEVKETTEKKEPEKKEPAKKTPAKKTPKKTAKKGAKRGPKPASERTVDFFVQYGEKEVSYTDIVNRIKDMWKEQGKRETSMKSLKIYVKPEEFKAYYVINDKITGELDF